jgi:hypothetical protein
LWGPLADVADVGVGFVCGLRVGEIADVRPLVAPLDRDRVTQEPHGRLTATDVAWRRPWSRVLTDPPAAELAHYAPAEGEARLAMLAAEPSWENGLRLLHAFAAELTGEAHITAAHALAEIDRDEGMRLLRELAESPAANRSERVHAASALGDFDPQLKDALLRMLGVDIKPGGWFST